jgi:hypothetical protein
MTRPYDVQNLNRYSYASDNPTTSSDPSGLMDIGSWVKHIVDVAMVIAAKKAGQACEKVAGCPGNPVVTGGGAGGMLCPQEGDRRCIHYVYGTYHTVWDSQQTMAPSGKIIPAGLYMVAHCLAGTVCLVVEGVPVVCDPVGRLTCVVVQGSEHVGRLEPLGMVRKKGDPLADMGIGLGLGVGLGGLAGLVIGILTCAAEAEGCVADAAAITAIAVGGDDGAACAIYGYTDNEKPVYTLDQTLLGMFLPWPDSRFGGLITCQEICI